MFHARPDPRRAATCVVIRDRVPLSARSHNRFQAVQQWRTKRFLLLCRGVAATIVSSPRTKSYRRPCRIEKVASTSEHAKQNQLITRHFIRKNNDGHARRRFHHARIRRGLTYRGRRSLIEHVDSIAFLSQVCSAVNTATSGCTVFCFVFFFGVLVKSTISIDKVNYEGNSYFQFSGNVHEAVHYT